MAEFLFSVAAQGDLCMVGGKGSYYVERGVAGAFTPYKIHNQIVRVGDSNPCVQIDHAGDYRVVWVAEAACCGLPPATPTFVYTEAGGCLGGSDGVVVAAALAGNLLVLSRSAGLPPLTVDLSSVTGAADGVVTAATLTGNVLELARSNGLPTLNVDLSTVIGSGFDPADPANVSALMAAMSDNQDAVTVTDAFGAVVYHGLPI